MSVDLELSHLLDYTAWERAQWRAWFREQGPAALAVGLGPNGDGRVNTIGELVRHIFAAELRYAERIRQLPLTDPASLPAGDVEALFALGERSRGALLDLLRDFPRERWDQPQQVQIGPQPRAVTPRKMVVQAILHEIRHWAQVSTLLRIGGRKGGSRDFLASPVLDPPGSRAG